MIHNSHDILSKKYFNHKIRKKCPQIPPAAASALDAPVLQAWPESPVESHPDGPKGIKIWNKK